MAVLCYAVLNSYGLVRDLRGSKGLVYPSPMYLLG